MKAVILAGGKGTRMGNLTEDIPKPMLCIGKKPLLEHHINLLKKFGVTDIIILVNHLKNKIIDHFQDGKEFGVSISYFEEPSPLGTVGGIKEIEERLQEDFLVIYGDVMINMNLERLIKFHHDKKSECTLVLHPNDHPYDSDLLEVDTHCRIKAFYPKPHDENKYYRNLVNAGVYILTPKIFHFLEKGIKADFGRDIFPGIFNKIKMFGYNTSEYLKDMGTPARYEKVNKDLESSLIEKASFSRKQKAIFLDRDGVINVERSFISNPDELEIYPFTPDAVKKINTSGYLAIVITNQSVIARNLCTIDELEKVHKKMETELGKKGAKFDRIYYCPHHPDKGYPEENPAYKIECSCRKPKPGMFFLAAHDYNIDLQQSYMIGDTERDVLAGKNAGCKTIGVMTGYGLKDTNVKPDFFFHDLKEAIDFIADDPFRQHASKVTGLFMKCEMKPYIINIAGNTRTGKTNFSAYLEEKFGEMKVEVSRVEIDQWILPEDRRNDKMNVSERFQVEKITGDLEKYLNGEEITLEGYCNHPKKKTHPVTYSLGKAEVVIIEGIVALENEQLRNLADLKIFMKTEEKKFLERITRFYQWKEYPAERINNLYTKRRKDEYDIIDKNDKFADIVIDT